MRQLDSEVKYSETDKMEIGVGTELSLEGLLDDFRSAYCCDWLANYFDRPDWLSWRVGIGWVRTAVHRIAINALCEL